MGFKYTTESFSTYVNEVTKQEYKVLGEYKGITTHIKITHIPCGTTYEVAPSNFTHGKRCPVCQRAVGNRKRCKDSEWFKNKVYPLFKEEYTLLSPYKKAKLKVTVRHNTCGTEYEVTPSKVINGRRCPKCARIKASKRTTKTHSEFLKEFSSLYGLDYEVVTNYTKATIPVTIKHKVCGTIYERTPRALIDYHPRCPKCSVMSVGEKLVGDYLEDKHISYESQKRFSDCYDNKPLSYDFFLPDYNTLIEYQGEQHYHPKNFFGTEYFNVQVKHDMIKQEYAEKQGIKLILIPYWYKDLITIGNFIKESLDNNSLVCKAENP